jgi:hypothetical protein
MIYRFLVIALLILSPIANSAVWKAKPGVNWDAYWDLKFQRWIKSEVNGDFFKKLGGSYESLPLDCADAFYGLKIYFSFKNGLPWRSAGQKWNSERDKFEGGYSNDISKWDHLEKPDDRVAELINHLISRLGTESLANLDTYPVSLFDVRPGDMFMYKYGESGSYTRHAYIIKNVNEDGTFEVLYGTQLRAKKLRALGQIGSEYLQHKPDRKNWGFKRYKSNIDIETESANIPVANYEQYEIAKRVTETEFFDYVNTALRIYQEGPAKKVRRLLSGLCRSLQAREIVVDDALDWQTLNPNTCMNEGDYDAFSTPSRDLGIKKKYLQLQSYYKKLESDGLDKKVSSRNQRRVKAIFNKSQRSSSAMESLISSCKITVGSEALGYQKVNIASFYDDLKKKDVSFHPNDNALRRWGFKAAKKTSCKQYYGYKE